MFTYINNSTVNILISETFALNISVAKLCPTFVTPWTVHGIFLSTTKVRLVKPMAFPVVMYGCESWTVKKAER